jgi:uncharacterized C2H2 Zn-finger protein
MNPDKMVQCKNCGKVFKNRSELYIHKVETGHVRKREGKNDL